MMLLARITNVGYIAIQERLGIHLTTQLLECMEALRASESIQSLELRPLGGKQLSMQAQTTVPPVQK